LDNKNNLLDSFYGSGSYRGRGKIKKADVVRGLFALGTLSISTLVTEAWAIESDFEGSFSAAGTIALYNHKIGLDSVISIGYKHKSLILYQRND